MSVERWLILLAVWTAFFVIAAMVAHHNNKGRT